LAIGYYGLSLFHFLVGHSRWYEGKKEMTSRYLFS
jgi:hypothetical protein